MTSAAAADRRVGGDETAFEFREGGAGEHIRLRHVLHMHQRIRRADALAESVTRRRALAIARKGVAAGLEKGAADLIARFSARDRFREAEAVASLRRAEDAQERAAFAPRRRERIGLVVLVQRRHRRDGVVKQRDEAGEHVAEQSRNMQRDVHARKIALCEGQNLEAGHARAGVIPHGRDAHQRQRLREILAAGADRRAAPQIEHDIARPFAMLLRMTRHHLARGAGADVMRGARRHMARIDAEEIAARRQHIDASTRGRARRAGLDETACERAQQSRSFRPRRKGRAPNTCSPSPMRISFTSQSQASSRASASARSVSRVTPHSCARPLRSADVENRLGDELGAARVERRGARIFVEQALDFSRLRGESRFDERRRHMADRHRAGAPLGLRRLAGIIDDERIDERRRRRAAPPARKTGPSITDLPGSHSSVPCVPR